MSAGSRRIENAERIFDGEKRIDWSNSYGAGRSRAMGGEPNRAALGTSSSTSTTPSLASLPHAMLAD